MKSPQILLLALIIQSFSQAQTSAIPATLKASIAMNRLSSLKAGGGNMLYGIPMAPAGLLGDYYLNTSWNTGSILLYDSEKLIEGYPIKYDMNLNEVEINAPGGVKVLEGAKIKSFTWQDSLTRKIVFFVNAKDYINETGTPLTGFFEVLSDGKMPAFKKTSFVIKKANYVKEFDTGTRDDQVLKTDEFYYVKDNKVYEIPSSKKKALPVFGDQAEKVKEYVDINGMGLKEAHHIQAIFDYYNSLVKN